MKSQGITFTNGDTKHLSYGPHHEALVISANLQGYWIRRILIDNDRYFTLGSVQENEHWHERSTTRRCTSCRLRRRKVHPVGTIQLKLTLGVEPKAVKTMVEFLVVDLTLS